MTPWSDVRQLKFLRQVTMPIGNIRQARHASAFTLALICFSFAEPVLAQQATTSVEAQSPKQREAIEKLRTGGYVVYVRHTQTDSKTEDKDLSDMGNCAGQRLLSDQGRENAAKLGEALKALAVPVGDVITSQFCRAKETAKLMKLEISKETADLNNDSGEPFVTKPESERRGAALRKLLAVQPEQGKNTLIIGHVPNLRNALSLDYANMKEGEIAIFAAKKDDPGFELVARITQGELQNFAKLAAN
jgi:phosphohistidine phosphatase SixA